MMPAKSRFIIGVEGRTSSRRPAKVGDAIRNEIATLLLFKINDPRLRTVAITGVAMTSDLKVAKVHYSCAEEDQQPVAKGLESAKGFIRGYIGRELKMRYVPELIFKRDMAVLRQQEMDKLFQEIKAEDESFSDRDC